jgi:hypothetical protein
MEFKMNLSYESWDNVFDIDDDVSLTFNNFLNLYLRISNLSFPYKKVFIKPYKATLDNKWN